MIPTIFTTLAVGIQVLSQAGQAFLGAIITSALFVSGSQIVTGHTFIINDSNTTTTPAVYLNDETTAIKTWPTALGVEHCEGNTGALICTMNIKLTGSGGHRNNNAGSFVCTTSTCSMISIQVSTESIPVLNGDRLYLGWTTSPGTQSGAQFVSWGLTSSGLTLLGSGSYLHPTSKQTVRNGLVPPGATVKAVWTKGNGSEDYGSYKAAARFTYFKYYNP